MSRVYVGSFHDKPIAREEHSALFAKDREVLLGRLKDLPKVNKCTAACHLRVNRINIADHRSHFLSVLGLWHA